MNKSNVSTDIYFGKYINNNVLSLDILTDNFIKYLNDNFKKIKSYKTKIYLHNNLYYEINNKKHKCFKKNNFRNKEFNKNDIVVKMFNYEKKYLDLDIFPSLTEYYNEESLNITEYESDIKLIKSESCMYLCLTNYNQNLIEQLSSKLN